MLPSIDDKPTRADVPPNWVRSLIFMFWGGGPTLGVTGKASTLGGGGVLGREPGVAGASRDSTERRRPPRGAVQHTYLYHSTHFPIVNGYVRIN